MADQIRVNGNLLSWGSIIVKIDGDRYHGITSIAYADKRERVKGYGSARHQGPRGRSRGKYSTEPVKVTGFRSSLQAMRVALAAKAGDNTSYGDAEFDVVIQYVEADETPITVELERCVWTSNSATDEEGADPLKEDVEFDCMLIRRNGLVLFDASEGSP
jgi:hypothetical protein